MKFEAETKTKEPVSEAEILSKLEAFEKNNKILKEILDEKIVLQEQLVENIEIDESLTDIHISENKIEKLNKLREQKEELIQEAIGQMYKGTLVEGKLTIRNGKAKPFRRQYSLGSIEIKGYVLGNLHEVRGKLSDENLTIIEFLFEKIDEDESRNETELAFLPIDNYILANNDYKKEGEMKVKVYDVIKITKTSYNIKMRACYKGQEIWLNDEEKKILLYRHREKLKEIISNLNKTVNSLIKTREQEIEDIKNQAKNLLIVSALQKNGDEK